MRRSATRFLLVSLLLIALSSCNAKTRLDQYGDALPEGVVARLGTVRFRSGPDIRAAALSPDGKSVVLCTDGIDVMDASTGRLIRKFSRPEPNPGVFAAAFSPDGTLLATGDPLENITIYDFASGKVARTIEYERRGVGMGGSSAFSADGHVFARSTPRFRERGEIRAWDVYSGKLLIKTDVLQSTHVGVALSPDGKVLASWGSDLGANLPLFGPRDTTIERTVQLWDLATAKELRRLHLEGEHLATGAGFTPDGKALAVATAAGSVLILDWTNGKELRRLTGGPKSGAAYGEPIVQFSPDGRRLAIGFDGVRIWDLPTGKRLSRQKGPPSELRSLVFLGDRVLGCGTTEHAVHVWDAVRGDLRRDGEAHSGQVRSVAFVAEGRTVYSVDSNAELCTWNADTGRRTLHAALVDPDSDSKTPPAKVRYFGPLGFCARLSAHGKLLLLGNGAFENTRLRDLEAGRELCQFPVFAGWTLPAGFSDDGKLVALGGKDPGTIVLQGLGLLAGELANVRPRNRGHRIEEEGQNVALFQTDGKLQRRFRGLKGAVVAVALSPDGRCIAATGTTAIELLKKRVETCVWDAHSGRELTRFSSEQEHIHSSTPMPLAFSPDGSLLASAESSDTVCLREATTGKKIRELKRTDALSSAVIAFSPDGRLLAVGSSAPLDADTDKPRIDLWEVSTGLVRKELVGHTAKVTTLAFSDDGRWLASGSADTTVLVWDLR